MEGHVSNFNYVLYRRICPLDRRCKQNYTKILIVLISVSKLSGPLGDAIPPDAEVSPELIAALASQQLNPEDIEIVTDVDGKEYY